jgi:Ca2+-binding RTX toxin-like protein
MRVSDIIENDFDIEQADLDGDGDVDIDFDDPDRPRPRFLGIDAVLDPAELAQGRRVPIGTSDVVEFRGEKFVVVRMPEGFVGNITLQYRIADTEGLEDVGFIEASVEAYYNGLLRGTGLVDYMIGGAGADTMRGLGRDDMVIAMAGNDVIETGLGNDVIDAGKATT